MEIRLLFKDEVNNVSELEDKLNEIGFNLEYKMGVIGMVTDQKNKVILMTGQEKIFFPNFRNRHMINISNKR